MKNSGLGKLNLHDLAKGGIVALLSAAITSLIQILESGHLPDKDQLIAALIAGITGALAYLIKNLGTNNQAVLLKKNVDAPTPAPNNPTPATSNPDKPRGGGNG